MHKGVILIVKAGSKDKALEKTNDFLEESRGQTWDWYQIGGRWTQTLAPMINEFHNASKDVLEYKNGFLSQQEVDSKQEALQDLWEKLGGKGLNPYTNHYNLSEEGGYYDIVPLSSCIEKVREWQQDPVKDGFKVLEDAKRWLKPRNKEDDYSMYGYCLNEASNLFRQIFSFDANVFNVDNYDFSIPKDLDDYFAVMVDMHN